MKLLFTLALAIVCASRLDAQTLTGNLFAAAGAFICCDRPADEWQLGVGGDLPVTPRFSIGGDFGALGARGSRHGSARFISIDGRYHIGSRTSEAPLFISGGLGVGIVYDAAPGGFFFGSGFDWWPHERRGLRIEVRDQLFEEYGTTHLVTVRAAWLFR